MTGIVEPGERARAEALDIRYLVLFFPCLVPTCINTKRLLPTAGEQQFIIDFNKPIGASMLGTVSASLLLLFRDGSCQIFISEGANSSLKSLN